MVTFALGLAACGGDDDEGTTADSTTAVQSETDSEQPQPTNGGRSGGGGEPAGLAISASESQFGTILFDEDDRAIYLFDKETTSKSECYGQCAAAWPPVLTKGGPQAAGGAEAKLLGTTERDDGTTQVTYAGQPLYYYVDDPPGEVLCHNVDEFGGLWLVVQPDGEPAA
ncbi:MAG: hypothetical protein ABI726_07400 [bacterium]